MTQPSLPLLFLSDVVVLPGMVVPSRSTRRRRPRSTRPAATGENELLIAPRLEDRYASYGVVATVERVGRLMGGGPGAVLRAGRRARIGSGVTGPGAALWVEVEPVDETVSPTTRGSSPRSTSGSSSRCSSVARRGRSSTPSTG